jgi:hypothetical protein
LEQVGEGTAQRPEEDFAKAATGREVILFSKMKFKKRFNFIFFCHAISDQVPFNKSSCYAMQVSWDVL